MCRKGRNKICYIRHIFSVFLKFTPKFGQDLLRSLDGIYSEVWTDFTPKFGRDGEGLTQNLLKFSAHESHEWSEQCWNINVQKLLHKMPLIPFWTNGENSSRFNEEINEAIDEH